MKQKKKRFFFASKNIWMQKFVGCIIIINIGSTSKLPCAYTFFLSALSQTVAELEARNDAAKNKMNALNTELRQEQSILQKLKNEAEIERRRQGEGVDA